MLFDISHTMFSRICITLRTVICSVGQMMKIGKRRTPTNVTGSKLSRHDDKIAEGSALSI